MSRYFIEVAYKGTAYSGFQVQENAVTIQSELEKALFTLHRQPIHLTGSSRTDAGVHALQNYFHFDFDNLHPQSIYKLNAILPPDIAVSNIHLMPGKAHSRFDALSRRYIYKLHQRKNPFLKDASLYYPYKLDISLLMRGAEFIKNQQNFFAFSKTNTQVQNFKCQLYHCEWVQNDDELLFLIEGNRFLRGMVRLITATLLKTGREKLSMERLEGLFTANQKAGYSVPAHGLYLTAVTYPENYFSATSKPFTGF
jgi:tRNA pseudouridine38-40 synthase